MIFRINIICYLLLSLSFLQSNSLNNFHLKTAIDFITKSLNDDDRLFFELNNIDFNNPLESDKQPVYNKVIIYIENYLIDLN